MKHRKISFYRTKPLVQCGFGGSKAEPFGGDISRVGRAGTSGDIAPVVLFLCSDGARWINGANLPVDGGLEASINAEVLGF